MPAADDQTRRFYDELADEYELAYGGRWHAAVEHQGAALDALIRELAPSARTVLDCSCGIGTQALGLARLGYDVVGSDVSAAALERARREAKTFGVEATFVQVDFRDLQQIEGPFDVVISCDNALPHLLDSADVTAALEQMHAKLGPGGVLIVTMRDFDDALRERPPLGLPVVVPGPPRRVLVRLHDWEGDRPVYTVRYLVLTEGTAWSVREHTARYRAIRRDELAEAARDAGLVEVDWPERTIVGGQIVMTARASRT